MTDERTLQYQNLTIDEHLDLIDAIVGKIEPRTDEFSAEDAQFVVEVANRLNSLANHFQTVLVGTLHDRFPHVPDEVLLDAPGAHEGSPFPIFSGGPPMTNRVLDRVFSGEVEEGPDEEEQ